MEAIKMSKSVPAISYDTIADVLYVRFADAVISNSKNSEDDSYTVFNLNDAGEIVGLQLLAFSEATETYWRSFKNDIPPALYEAVLNWIGK